MERDRSSLWWLVAGVALVAAGVAVWSRSEPEPPQERRAVANPPAPAPVPVQQTAAIVPPPTPVGTKSDERMQQLVHAVLAKLIADYGAGKGSIATARQWANRDLPAQLWNRVGGVLSLTPDEIERAWKQRTRLAPRTVSFGSGSHLVVVNGIRPKPTSEDAWWDGASAAERSQWLLGTFVEASGMFEVVRASESSPCQACKGSVPGPADPACTTCRGFGAVRTVEYR